MRKNAVPGARKPSTKQIGDAGEYYLLSMLNFAGVRVIKMPENFPRYDLYVQPAEGRPQRVAVECRERFPNQAPAFILDVTGAWEWFAAVIRFTTGETRWWVLPQHAVLELATKERNTDKQRLNIKTLIERGSKWESYISIHEVKRRLRRPAQEGEGADDAA